MLTLVNPEGVSAGTLDFAKTAIQNLKADKVLAFEQTLQNGNIVTTYQKLSSLEGYTVKKGDAVVATLTANAFKNIDTLKALGFVEGKAVEEFTDAAKEALEAEDDTEPKFINIKVHLAMDDETADAADTDVEFKFDREGKIPTVKTVTKQLLESEEYATFISQTEYEFLGLFEQGNDAVALPMGTKLSEDITLCIIKPAAPVKEPAAIETPFFENPDNFEASPEEYHGDVTYYRLVDGVFVADPKPIAGNGIQYYTIKPGVTVPENN